MSSQPAIASTVEELRAALAFRGRGSGATTALVPTMGYLHEGHASLMRLARAQCDIVVLSIFVNPTQFGPNEDFTTYPRDFERDMRIATDERVDIVFAPKDGGFYPQGAATRVSVSGVTARFEGASRPGHFDGVATVVAMLFNAVQPDVACFGEKDWQQLKTIERMCIDLHFPVRIAGAPIVRESDGLAMSSRNVRLSPEARASATRLSRAIGAARSAYADGEKDPAALRKLMHEVLEADSSIAVDYAEVVDQDTLEPIETATASSRLLVAARVGGVRLIDNAALA